TGSGLRARGTGLAAGARRLQQSDGAAPVAHRGNKRRERRHRLRDMSRLVLDLRVAARTLVRSRFVSALECVAFAFGTVLTTAVFSIFNGVLLQPLPYPHPEQLVAVYDTQPACSTCPASFPKYIDWKTRNQVFSAIGGSSGGSVVMTGSGDPARVRMMSTTASLGDVFGVRPQIGRWYTEQEDQPGGPKVVVLTYEFWTERFAHDPAVIG